MVAPNRARSRLPSSNQRAVALARATTMANSRLSLGLRILAASSLMTLLPNAYGFGTFDVIGRSGQPIPGTNSTATLQVDTILYDANVIYVGEGGTSVFRSELRPSIGTNNQNTGVYTLSPGSPYQLSRIAQAFQPTPGGDGTISRFERIYYPAQDGTTYFYGLLSNVTQFGTAGLYRSSPAGLVEVMRNGKPLAAGLPALCSVNGLDPAFVFTERNGDVIAMLNVQQTSSACNRALYRVSASGTFTELARVGSTILGTSASITSFSTDIASDREGSVAFLGRDSSSSSNSHIYRWSADGIRRLSVALSNDNFYSSRNGVVTLWSVNENTVTQFNAAGTGVQRFRRGQGIPGQAGQFFSLEDVSVSRDGEIVARIGLTATPNGLQDDQGIYLADSAGIVEIAREGRPAVQPNSTFRTLSDPRSNGPIVRSQGRVLFTASYLIGTQSRVGVFYYDRVSGLREVLNTDTIIAGSRVVDFQWYDGINERGESPLFADLADGSRVALMYRVPGAPPPPPPPAARPISGNLSGAWFDPARSGEGVLIDIARVGNRNVVFLAWFTYLNGQQLWLAGNADFNAGATTITLPMASTRGTGFGNLFNSTQVIATQWGTISLEFRSCNELRLQYNGGGQSGSLVYQRLVGNLIDVPCI